MVDVVIQAATSGNKKESEKLELIHEPLGHVPDHNSPCVLHHT